ncbi:putative copper radical oxidase variant A [Lyophyllum shimeji]|uniref:Copper radical oxidase variant A n=1 Tax=Lyophyllum shimeji TaxID=47721 RepID=A0A9P3UL13_LYOSH|nr:putative copper radical oxidase variant A [Lyophyllum shimeji]
MLPPFSLLALCLASASSPVLAATAGSFADGGNTLVSAMMMFLGNEEKVYILDKAEGNPATVSGHPAWGSVWDIKTRQATVMDVKTNTFCSSGMHLPNGSYVTFGGNSAVGRGGAAGSTGVWDAEYQDFDGAKSIRVLNPCTSSDNFASAQCTWFDDPSVLSMQKKRWYSTAEPLADGSIVLIGGMVGGGYINRNTPDTTPVPEAAENSYEFYPSKGPATPLPFLYKTGGLNVYAHAFLLNSGKMLVQANVSTMIWDYNANTEVDLPDMPGNVVRVYPASGAVAMLPLTPANNYNPTILFCGGNDMPEPSWGNYSFPAINTWNYPASRDCHRLTPEPLDGSAPAYEADDDMLEGRSMGQFIILPDGKLLVVNGAVNGTAGYAVSTGETFSYGDMPFGMSLASGPVGTPALYDPNAPKGRRWSNAGLDKSPIARMYHSSAILLPDASVLIAGSNPNVDVNTSTTFPTEYRAEIFYPPYFGAKIRPTPSGVPKTIAYGGPSFDITIPASCYAGPSNAAAANTTVVLLRGGFTTHAMNMGQRYLQLNNTYTVNQDGSIVFHVSGAPTPNVFQPGPSLLFVTVNGIPSVGTMVVVGSGSMGTQPTAAPAQLPPNVLVDSAKGTADGASVKPGGGGGGGSGPGQTGSGRSLSTAAIIGGIVGAVALLGALAALGVCLMRRRRAARVPAAAQAGMMGGAGAGEYRGLRGSDASAFAPLHRATDSDAWNGSTANLMAGPYQGPYRDDAMEMRSQSSASASASGPPPPGQGQGYAYAHAPGASFDEYDPYGATSNPSLHHPPPPTNADGGQGYRY